MVRLSKLIAILRFVQKQADVEALLVSLLASTAQLFLNFIILIKPCLLVLGLGLAHQLHQHRQILSVLAICREIGQLGVNFDNVAVNLLKGNSLTESLVIDQVLQRLHFLFWAHNDTLFVFALAEKTFEVILLKGVPSLFLRGKFGIRHF